MTEEQVRLRWRMLGLLMAEFLETPLRCGVANSDINVVPFYKMTEMLGRHATEIRKEMDDILP